MKTNTRNVVNSLFNGVTEFAAMGFALCQGFALATVILTVSLVSYSFQMIHTKMCLPLQTEGALQSLFYFLLVFTCTCIHKRVRNTFAP